MLRERLHISLAKQIESVSSTLNPEKILIKTFTELDRSYIAEIRVLPKEDVSGSTLCVYSHNFYIKKKTIFTIKNFYEGNRYKIRLKASMFSINEIFKKLHSIM